MLAYLKMTTTKGRYTEGEKIPSILFAKRVPAKRVMASTVYKTLGHYHKLINK